MNNETLHAPAVDGNAPRVARPGPRPALRPDAAGDRDHLVWTVGDVAKYLQVSDHAIYKMTAQKAALRIPHIRIGGRLRFRRSAIDQWLDLLTVSNLETLARMRKFAQR